VNPGRRQRALCILGMHRSGTSAVTRALNLYGAFVGEAADLLPQSPTNPEGYWERTDIKDFHDRLLAVLRRPWDTGLVLPDGWHRAPEVAPYRAELGSIVGAAFAGRALWAWKDPRTCLLLDLWKEILGESGVELAAVFVVRHPRDVAASLRRRDGFGLEKSCGIWFAHTLAALRSLEGVRTAFVGYDNFLEDPAGQVQRCAAALDIDRPEGDAAAVAAIGKSVRKELRHSQAAADALDALPAPVRALYELTRAAVAQPASCDGAFFARIRELHLAYAAHAGFFREDLEQCELRVQAVERERAEAVRILHAIEDSAIWRITGPARRAADFVLGKSRPGGSPGR